MTYEHLKNLKRHNQTLKLLNSDNFALSISFFYFVFIKNNFIAIEHKELLGLLDDYLYDINKTYDNLYPKSAKEYLDDFSSDKNAYLKKYHGNEGELLYELTPYTQKALEILESLEKKEFVGSRTKFNIIFELLEELIFETDLDDKERIKILQKQKSEIDKKITAIQKKQDIRFDESRIKEHFMLIEEQARKLKYDFSQIEYNFRELNLSAMQSIATANESKDSVLSSIFDIEESIRQSDQGKSFFAFWQILSDSEKNEKFSYMLEHLYKLNTIKEFDKNQRLKNLKYDLLANANKIVKVTSKLIEQLRRFLDERVWVENRKILELCKDIEQKAIDIKSNPPPKREFICIDETKVKIDSVFEKSLYTIKKANDFKAEIKVDKEEIDLNSFYDIFFIDEDKLKNHINYLLQIHPQVTLKQITEKFPVKKGVSEVVAYLSIAKNSANCIIEINTKDKIEIEDENKIKKVVTIPKIIFTRSK